MTVVRWSRALLRRINFGIGGRWSVHGVRTAAPPPAVIWIVPFKCVRVSLALENYASNCLTYTRRYLPGFLFFLDNSVLVGDCPQLTLNH